MASVRRLAAKVVARGAALSDVLAASEELLGVPIRVREGEDLFGPSAVVTLIPGEFALIQIDRSVTPDRKDHVLGHELGHLLLGHSTGQRSHYHDARERDAELFATLVVRRMRMEALSPASRAVR